ncbi:hypothetical protein BH24ACI3_BH24ACI3_14970 [soil metagenome]
MKNLKNTLAAFTMMFVLAFGTTFANAGIIVAGFNERSTTSRNGNPCKDSSEKQDVGIIVAGIGIIVAGLTGFTGIIVAGVSERQSNCGIIVAGRKR